MIERARALQTRLMANTSVWLVLVVGLGLGAFGLIAVEFGAEHAAMERVLLNQARAYFKTIVATRAWNAGYGGVYVEKREGVASNPYLDNPDVTLTDGRVLTLRNPAMMTRELSALTNRDGDYKTHITSLKLRNPANAPDAWERNALHRFERQGVTEVFERVTERQGTVFRYMAPLYVEKPCLACHADQGYQVGDVRGGISVSIPMRDHLAAFWTRLLGNALWVVLLLSAMAALTFAGLQRIQRARNVADQARARFEALLQGTEGTVWEAETADLRFTFVSQRGERLLGYSPDRWRAPGFWLERLHPDDRERVVAARRDGVQRAAAHELDYRLVRVDGMTVWVHDLATVVSRPDASPRVHGVMIDITARKHAELAQMANQAEQDALLSNALIGIVYLRERRIVRCNPRFADMFGYPMAEMIGQSTQILYATRELFESVGASAYAALGQGQAFTVDARLKRRDGTVFWGTITGRAIDASQPHAGSVWLYADISERKAAEGSASMWLRAIEASPVSIVITDREGRIEYVNPRFTQVTGYAAREVRGQNPRLLQSGNTPMSTYTELWGRLSSGREWRGVLQNRRKNGELFWEEAAMVPIFDEQGAITHFLAVKEDISGRIAMERELDQHRHHLESEVLARTRDLALAVEKATAADRAKTEFLTNMSHEIRTPLNAVIGFSRLAMRADPSPRLADYLGKIDASGQLLLELINNLLDLAKIASGRMEMEQAAFDLSALLARIASVFSFRAAEKRLALRVEVGQQVPTRLLGDSLRLNQVLINLVGNAIKFTERGEVVLSVTTAGACGDSVSLEFSVRDTGIGMTADEIERAFEPFTQADASITRRYGGTGLGLAIARQLVSLMGGALTADSQKAAGTTFRFTLTLACDPGAASADSLAASSRLPRQAPLALRYRFHQVRVLVAEDQPLNRQVVRELLDAVGVEVDLVEDGQKAIERLAEHPRDHYDLVLMDLQMPVLDGLSAMQKIRAENAWRTLPIIAMTAHVLEEERRRAAAAGASDHLGKPFDPAHLYALIAAWVKPEKVFRETPTPPAAKDAGAGPDDDIDLDVGLMHFGGNAASYRTWLARFRDEHRAWSAQLQERIDRGDGAGAQALAHALKGTSGTLGLLAVQAAAAQVEAAARQGDDLALRTGAERLARTLTGALVQLEQIPEIGSVADAPLVADAQPFVDSLIPLLDKFRLGTGDALEFAEICLARVLGTPLETPVRDLVAAAREFDFDRAEADLKKLLARLLRPHPGEHP